jgi:hypothetical protein
LPASSVEDDEEEEEGEEEEIEVIDPNVPPPKTTYDASWMKEHEEPALDFDAIMKKAAEQVR